MSSADRQPLLHVGSASLPATPPIGVDLVGFLRRSRASRAYAQPLEVGALVADDGHQRLAIIALDLLATPAAYGRRLRESVAETVGCPPDAVLVNSSHTHAGPPPPGMLKLGGTTFELREEERRYADSVVDLATSASVLATERLAPAVISHGQASCLLAVNRRQREPDGSTIVGWNPDGPVDQTVDVVRVDATNGTAMATIVVYGCHPTVVGPASLEISSDYVGPLRNRVRAWTGGDCLFLQGCGGNVFPQEACFAASGPEVVFGDTLAAAALHARAQAAPRKRVARETRMRSAIPIALWRFERAEDEDASHVRASERSITLRFGAVPTLDELRAIEAQLEEQLHGLVKENADADEINPLRIHAEWARRLKAELDSGGLPEAISLPLQALRLGSVGIVGLPCEPFAELGLQIKSRAAAPVTIVLGYTNDMVGYVPPAEEYAHGGYEVNLAHRHFERPAPVSPDASQCLVETGIELLETLF
jgi:neutral ceramidase